MYVIIGLAVTLFLFAVERIVHSFLVLMWGLFHGKGIDLKTYSALNLFLSVFQLAWNVVFAVVILVGTLMVGLLSKTRFLVTFVAFGLFMTFLYEFQGEVFLELMNTWNEGLGERVRNAVLVPVELAQPVIQAVLPLFNVITWMGMQVIRILIFGVNYDLGSFAKIITSLALMFKNIILSFVAYSKTFTACAVVANLTDTRCFEPGLRQFDLVTPLTNLGEATEHTMVFLHSNCAPIAGLANVALYLFTDSNFILATHNIANSVLYTVFQMPLVTWERGKYAKGRGFEKIMKMPDLNPTFDFAVDGVRGLGIALDTWLDIIAITIEGIFTGKQKTCPVNAAAKDLPGPDPEIFGTRETRLVSLTNGMYAITDGINIEYVSYYREVERRVALGAWPLEVDVRMGIAAVRYSAEDEIDNSGEATTAMMGCRCDDYADTGSFLGSRMEVTCAIIPYTDDPSIRFGDYFVPTSFQVKTTAGYTNCDAMTFSVQSVRWPLTRVGKPDVAGVSPALTNQANSFSQKAVGDKNHPSVVDAVIWAIPRCDVGGGPSNYACIDGFIHTNCYPYCMAARSSASGNTALVFYSASDWDEQVHLMHRFCDPSATIFTTERPPDGGHTAEVRFPQGTLNGNAYSQDNSTITKCEYKREAVTIANKTRLPTYENPSAFRLRDQPYVVAGDAALFVSADDNELYVKRLFAMDNWQFTVDTVPQRIPVNAACRNITNCKDDRGWDPTKVTVQPGFSRSPGTATAAVATRWSVFHAVNPDADVYSEFMRWCALVENAVKTDPDTGKTTGTQFSNKGSYGAPIVWRIDAFAGDLGLVSDSTSHRVPFFVDFIGYNGKQTSTQCAQPMNMSIVSMSYINERNVAITVLEASPSYFNPVTNKAYSHLPKNVTAVRYVIYYLDPITMQMQTHRLWTDRNKGAVLDDIICPELRRMPLLGSVLSESSIAGLEIIRMPMNVLMSFPVLADLDTFAEIRDCPVVTRGHTLLRECGVYMFSLDRFFTAVVNANYHLWRTFSHISAALSDIPKANNVRVLLNGMNVYFSNSRNVISSTMRSRAVNSVKDYYSGMFGPGGASGFLSLSSKTGVGGYASRLASSGSRLGSAAGRWLGLESASGATSMFGKLPSVLTRLGGSMTSVATKLVDSGAVQAGSSAASSSMGVFKWAFSGVVGTLGFSWWSYNSMVSLILDLISDTGPKTPMEKIWSQLYDSRVEYNILVTHQMEKTCTGMGLIFGGSGAMAETSMAWCLMQVYAADGILNALSVLMVDYVMMDCMCGAPGGSDFTKYVTDICLKSAPREYVPAIMTALDAGLRSGLPKDMCIAVVESANDKLFHSFDMFFASFYDLAEAMGGILAQMLNQGSCTAFYTNPYLITLMPTPIEYWKVCGNTSACRLKCGDLLEAFEESKQVSDASGKSVLEYQTVVENPFMTVDDVLARKSLPPFEVLAMVEHGDCSEVCGKDTKDAVDGMVRVARCFSVAGINVYEQVEVAGYCVPSALGVSLWKSFNWTVDRSEEWTFDVVDIYFAGAFARKHQVSGKLDVPLVITRRDGIYLYRRSGIVRHVLRAMGNEAYDEVDFFTMHSIYDVYVVPGDFPGGVSSTDETPAIITVLGRTAVTSSTGSGTRSVSRCVQYEFAANGVTHNTYLNPSECVDPDETTGTFSLKTLVSGQRRYPVFIGKAKDKVLLIPTKQDVQVVICQFDLTTSYLSDCVFSKELKNALTDADLAGSESKYTGNVISENGSRNRRSKTMASTSFTGVIDDRSAKKTVTYSLFSASHGLEMWIAEVRIVIDLSNSEPVAIAKRSSTVQALSTTLIRDCTVNSCGACNSLATQKLCYAAQQCTVSKCIGTPVNFRTPLCAWGSMLKDVMELGASWTVGAWYAVYEVTALTVNHATGVASGQVYLTFPHEIVNLLVCEMKDLIVVSLSSVTTIISSVTFTAREVADMTRFSPETTNEFFAETTLTTASVTNLFAHILYFPLYNLFAFVQVISCGVNDITAAFDAPGRKIRVGSPETLSAFGSVAGECMSVLVADDVASATEEAAREEISNYVAEMAKDQRSVYVSDESWTYGQETPDPTASLGFITLSAATIAYRQLPVNEKPEVIKDKLPLQEADSVEDDFKQKVGVVQENTKDQRSNVKFQPESVSKNVPDNDKKASQVINSGSKASKTKKPTGNKGLLSKILGNRVQSLMQTPARTTMHWLDAVLAWGIGVVRSVQDVMQTVDRRNCKLPDVTIVDIPTCPCGDTVVKIPELRRKEGIHDGAFWCTGTMEMVLTDGTSKIIYNPHTFEELVKYTTNIDEYLKCIAEGNPNDIEGGCVTIEPVSEYLQEQGVSTIAVLTRCRTNFANKQWDSGAAFLFLPEVSDDLVNNAADILADFDMFKLPQNVYECVLTSIEQNSLVDFCHDLHLTSKSMSSNQYYTYESTGKSSDHVSFSDTDACEVFTGPAKDFELFENCIDSIEGTSPVDDAYITKNCEMEYFLWAGRSSNKVPLATPHYKGYSSHIERMIVAKGMIRDTQAALKSAFDAVSDWDGTDLDVVLFTADGDGLHQTMDCMIMGPYAAADIWPGPPETMGKLRYSRTAAAGDMKLLSRTMKVPCGSGDDLDGDTESPFTCGSPTRKAIMKYFVRDILHGDEGIIEEMVTAAVRDTLVEMNATWMSDDLVGCRGTMFSTTKDGKITVRYEYSLSYCSDSHPEYWTDLIDQTKTDTKVSGDLLLDSLMGEMEIFAKTDLILNTVEIMEKYYATKSTPTEGYEWDEEEALIAASFSMFNPLEAVVRYDSSETNQPLKTSLWDMCTAHMAQFMSTFPMSTNTDPASGEEKWTLAGLFGTVPFDPMFEADYSQYANSIETYVRKISKNAEDESPFLWQYVLRHVPSDSLVCKSYHSFVQREGSSGISYDEADIPITSVLSKMAGAANKRNVPNPIQYYYGAFSGALGEIHSLCVCEWYVGHDKSRCSVPTEVCIFALAANGVDNSRYPSLSEMCNSDTETVYDSSEEEVIIETHAAITEMAQQGTVLQVPCNSLQPSDRWGVHGDGAVGNWTRFQKFNINLRDVATDGRGGMRLGNLFQLHYEWNNVLHNGARHKPLVHTLETKQNSSVAQKWCKKDMGWFSRESRNLAIDRYVEELFPVAQTVKENAPFAFCTRFMVEVARHSFLQRLSGMGIDSVDIDLQQETVNFWREKCRYQVGIVNTCNLRGVYETIPSVKQTPEKCPFRISDSGGPGSGNNGWYVTSTCLVYSNVSDTFHDPCNCFPCNGYSQTAFQLESVWTCPVANDIRKLIRNTRREMNAGLHWARIWEHVPEQQKSEIFRVVNDVLDEEFTSDIPMGLDSALFFQRASGNGPTNNTQFNARNDWRHDEGMYNARHCDTIFDWWLESDEYNEPVGYQVTVSPYHDEAGYKTFDNGFVVQRDGGEYVFISYAHSIARNDTLMKNNYGASGYCGMHSYGMDMQPTNTMRTCTSEVEDTHADPTVPITSSRQGTGTEEVFTNERCSDSHVPVWETDENIHIKHGTGLVNFWESVFQRTWPSLDANGKSKYKLPRLAGLEDEVSFGPECGFTALFTCTVDEDCRQHVLPGLSPTNLICMQRVDENGNKAEGVCAVREQGGAKFECVNHAGCGGDLMCSGDGQCVLPVITYRNNLVDTEIEAQVFASSCESFDNYVTAHDMWGSSVQEDVPDLLQSSGMCSYRSWFEHRSLISEETCNKNEQVCKVDGRASGIKHTSEQRDYAGASLWDEGLLKTVATACDFDYMHIDGMKECHTAQRVVLSETYNGLPTNIIETSPSFSKVFQTYDENTHIALFNDIETVSKDYAFAGISESMGSLLFNGESVFKYCSDIEQCHLQKFTVSGFTVEERLSYGPNVVAGILWDPNGYLYRRAPRLVGFEHIFVCGAFGINLAIEDSFVDADTFKKLRAKGTCVLEPGVNAFYYTLCHSNTWQGEAWDVSVPRIEDVCLFSNTYSSDYRKNLCSIPIGGGQHIELPFYDTTQIDIVNSHLNRMYTNLFVTEVDTISQYADTISCANSLYELQQVFVDYYTPPYNIVSDGGIVNDVRARGFYYFDKFALTEFPVAWWVHCTLLSGIAPASNQIVPCPAWDDKFDDLSDTTRTSGKSAMDVLRRFKGGITKEMLEAALDKTDNGRLATDTCNWLNINDVGTIRGYLASLFKNASQQLQSDAAFQKASFRKCHKEKRYNTEYSESETWTQEIYDFVFGGSSTPIQPAYLYSASEYVATRPGSVLDNKVWDHVCKFWFGNDIRDWFEILEDSLDSLPYSDGLGVPVAQYLFAMSSGDRFDIQRTIDDMLREYDENTCEMNLNRIVEPDPMCLYEKRMFEDPLWTEEYAQYNVPLSSLLTPYVLTYPGFDRFMVPEAERALGSLYGEMGTTNNYSYVNICSESPSLEDVSGDVCSAAVEGLADTCGPPWLDWYMKTALVPIPQNTVPTCVARSTSARESFSIKTDQLWDLQRNYPGHVCWRKNTQCLGRSLLYAQVIYFPPMVRARFAQFFSPIGGLDLHARGEYPKDAFCRGGRKDSMSFSFVNGNFGGTVMGNPSEFLVIGSSSVGVTAGLLGQSLGPYDSVGLEIMEGGFCCDTRYSSDCNTRCEGVKYALQIRKGLWKCIPCTKVSSVYCVGNHDCTFSDYVPVTGSADYDHLLRLGFDWEGEMTIERFTELTQKLLHKRVLDKGATSNFHILPDAGATRYDHVQYLEKFSVFDSIPATSYLESLSTGAGENSEGLGIQACARAKSNGLAIEYSKCSNDAFLRRFGTFVNENYKKDAFLRVSPGSVISWVTSKAQVTSETVYAFGQATKSLDDMFASWILNTELHCLDASMYSSICKVDSGTQKIELYSPWTGGEFNALELCDTSGDSDYGGTRVDVGCNHAACPNYRNGNFRLDSFFSGVPDRCISNQGDHPRTKLPPKSAENNICTKSPKQPATCSYRRGSLGGSSLNSDAGSKVTSLYGRGRRDGRIGKGGIFGEGGRKRNLLFGGKNRRQAALSGVTALKVSVGDIGGHYLDFSVSESGEMTLNSMILKGTDQRAGLYVTRVHSEQRNTTKESLAWLDNLEALFRVENSVARVPDLTPTNPSVAHWACPLRRLRYWSGAQSGGLNSPTLPEARRTRKLFSPLTGNLDVHPVMKDSPEDWTPVQYFTTGGMCVCTTFEECVFAREDTGPCTLIDTIKASYDQEWREVFDLSPGCIEQLDWPYSGGELRDGSKIEKKTTPKCSIFKRLPKFRVKQKPSSFPGKSGKTTSDEGGDCHMGRLMRDPKTLIREANFQESECRLHEKNSTHMKLLCGENQYITTEREKSKAPSWLIEQLKKKRRQCSEADQPPVFRTPENGYLPEITSFGLPFRVSSERFIAGDLARIMCGKLNCSENLNLSKWTPHKFLETLLKDPSALFAPGKTNNNGESTESSFSNFTDVDDTLLWNTPWVACTTDDNSEMNCSGTIPKALWMDPSTRGSACLEEMKAQNQNNLVMDLEICDLDDKMTALCAAIAEARKNFRTANCIAAGSCFSQYYFYYPGTYSVTNDEFVYDSVRRFYQRREPLACPATEAQNSLITQNNELRTSCSASFLEPTIVLLEYLRVVLQQLVRMAYYLFMIILKFLELIPTMIFYSGGELSSAVTRIFQEILMYLKLLLQEMGEMMKMFGNFMFEIIAKSPWGAQILDLYMKICEFVKKIWDFVQELICKIITFIVDTFGKEVIEFFFGDGENMWVEDTKGYGTYYSEVSHDYGYGGDEGSDGTFDLRDETPKPPASTSGLSVWDHMMIQLQKCSDPDSLTCKRLELPPEWEDGTLPGATRCWTQYMASFGSENTLSCTPADTCQQEDGSKVVCDKCPLQPVGIRDFGCDPITKLCRCGVMITERTPCRQHLDCTLDPSSECVSVDRDFDQTFGTLPCSKCTTRSMCLLNTGSESGYCACPLRFTGYESCDASATGSLVYVDPTGLCLTMGGVGRQNTDSYGMSYEEMAAIPCKLVETSKSFCFSVFLSATVTLHQIVALEYFRVSDLNGPFSNRRLLEDTRTSGMHSMQWNDALGLCSALMQQSKQVGMSAMSLTDYMAMQNCVKWRAVALDLIAKYNLTDVDDHFLLSMYDFSNAISRFDSLFQLLEHPQILYDVFLHSPYALPFRTAAQTFTRWMGAYFEDVPDAASSTKKTISGALLALSSMFITGDINYHYTFDFSDRLVPGKKETVAKNKTRYAETFAQMIHFSDAALVHKRPASEREAIFETRRLLWDNVKKGTDVFSQTVSESVSTAVRTLKQLVPDNELRADSDPIFDITTWTTRECPIGSELVRVLEVGTGVLAKEYTSDRPERGIPAESLRAAIPSISPRFNANSTVVANGPMETGYGNKDIMLNGIYRIRDTVQRVWDVRQFTYDLLKTSPETFSDFMHCDLEKIMYCTEYKRTIFQSSVLLLVATGILLGILRTLGAPLIGRLLVWMLPLFVLFFSLGYSPFCVPIVPPCVVDELVYLIGEAIPLKIVVPNSLQAYPRCLSGGSAPPGVEFVENGPVNASCLVSCFDRPHSFYTSEAPLAWWLCDMDYQICSDLADWLNTSAIPYTGRLVNFISEKKQIIEMGDIDLISAQRVCATLTAWYLIPWFTILGIMIYIVAWSITIPIVIMQGYIAVFFHSLITLHVSAKTRKQQMKNIYVQHDIRRSLRDGGKYVRQHLFKFW